MKKFKTSLNVSVIYDAKTEDEAYDKFLDDLVTRGEIADEIEIEEVRARRKLKDVS